MQKYGLKVQTRNKNIKLLTYIYKELHPTIDLCETIDKSVKNMCNEYEEPQKKRQKIDINLSDKSSNIERECNVSPFKNWYVLDKITFVCVCVHTRIYYNVHMIFFKYYKIIQGIQMIIPKEWKLHQNI